MNDRVTVGNTGDQRTGGGLSPDSLDRFFAGKALYGNDFSPEEIAQWYEDEREGYADLGARDRSTYRYDAHELNRQHIFRFLRPGRFDRVLGLGSAWGDEFLPILDRIGDLTIVDPSDSFVSSRVGTTPVRYVKPVPSGELPFDDGSFDLATSFGVLHHIPNVSTVIAELARVMKPGGLIAIREPMVSMGDWRKPRKGLTRRERGIPIDLLQRFATDAGLQTVHRSTCTFPLTVAAYSRLGRDLFNSRFGTRLDRILSTVFSFNERYHATTPWQKLRPSVAVLVLARPPVGAAGQS